MAASKLKDRSEGLITTSNPSVSGRILPVAIVYGANASGKSNLMAAMGFMRSAMLFSHSQGEPDGPTGRVAFALDVDAAKEPSTFQADFIVKGVRYHYGFSVTDNSFPTEWLHSYATSRRQILFECKGKDFEFGRNLRGRNRTIADLTRPNSLFVATATQNGHEELSAISAFFRSMSNVTSDSISSTRLSSWFGSKGIDKRVPELVGQMGTGIVDFRVDNTPNDEGSMSFRTRLAALLKDAAGIDPPDEFVSESREVTLGHEGADGDIIYLHSSAEGDGTRRFLVLLDSVFKALDRGTLLVVDELDASLHTQAAEAVVRLFLSDDTNRKGAQLIATTHDTNLLAIEGLRRDEIWFTEKDDRGGTFLFPLTEIRTRIGDNLERGYLQGRFGAIPFVGPVPGKISVGGRPN